MVHHNSRIACEIAIRVNLGQQESTEPKQDQFGEALKVVIEADQSPLVRDRECRQMGICAQPLRQIPLAHQQMKNIPTIAGWLRMTDTRLLQKSLQQC